MTRYCEVNGFTDSEKAERSGRWVADIGSNGQWLRGLVAANDALMGASFISFREAAWAEERCHNASPFNSVCVTKKFAREAFTSEIAAIRRGLFFPLLRLRGTSSGP